MKRLLPLLLALALAACGSAPKKPSPPQGDAPRSGHAARPGPGSVSAAPCAKPYQKAQEDPAKRGDYVAGGLYAPNVRDSTPDYVPNLACIPEPAVVHEPRSPIGNRTPYSVLGRQYHVMDRPHGYVEQGRASYYGAKFHGRLTSNREVYDMYAYTAAHKTLPLPSFAQVTNLDNGQSVIVRVNDRGPFHDGRVIDLSYAAAVKLDIVRQGTGRVEVRALVPDAGGSVLASAAPPAVPAAVAPAARATALDELVGRLPASPPPAAPATVASAATTGGAGVQAAGHAGASEGWRYHASAAPGQVASADQFEAWMRSRGVRVATGRPGTVAASAPVATASAAAVPPASGGPVALAAPPASTASAGSASGQGAGAVSLQVASFANRDNADRALARLLAAGIGGANLSSISSNGRSLWRLRVGPLERGFAAELIGRIAGLGLGTPHFVDD